MTGSIEWPRGLVDTNILVYAVDAAAGERHLRARQLIEALIRQGDLVVSAQVLNEFYVTATQKLKPGLSRENARLVVENLQAWRPVAIERTAVKRAFEVQDRFQLSFWDSLVVGCAQIAACGYLLTEDLQDGAEFEGLRVVSPFTHAPDSLPR